jgi:prepilin-type N-terminal cleavage/methylation domain-containing protein/prepilin-type processing-associated H-X9-DG protein
MKQSRFRLDIADRVFLKWPTLAWVQKARDAKRIRGFTLVELLVVIAIIGTLVGLLLPAVQAARESARRSQCTNNVKQVALALHNYQDANKVLPPSATNSTVDSKGRQGWSWMLFVLPYIEQAQLFDACMNQTTWNMQRPFKAFVASVQPLARAPIPPFLCPTDKVSLLAPEAKYNSEWSYITFTASKANYLANGGARSCWDGTIEQQMRSSLGAFRKVKGVAFKEFTDGLSKTILLGEVGGMPILAGDADWMPGIWPGTSNENGYQFEIMRYTQDKLNAGTRPSFGSFHSGGANFAMADASIRFVDETIQANPVSYGFKASTDAEIIGYLSQTSNSARGVWERLSTRADGLSIGDF